MLQTVKGMSDVLPSQMGSWRLIEDCARQTAERFGFAEIRTPLLEKSELFARGVGESTDIVEKEMYAFEDRGGEHLALRPEGTAGVVRAYIQHKLHASQPEARLYYLGPMYRRERPQKGRYRQFFQFGVEAFGQASARLDAEIMAMLHQFLTQVGLQQVVLEINSLGDGADRPAYLRALTDFLQPQVDALCPDCQRRLQRAPLRVLDCKVSACREITAQAPSTVDHLGADSQQHFDLLRRTLDRLDVPFRVNNRIVRGLDYYTRTVFEALAQGLGSQNAVCAGGRYDGLVEQLGGPATPAVGYAQGIERLVMLLDGRQAPLSGPRVALVAIGEAALDEAQVLACRLRAQGMHCALDLGGRSIKAQLRRANRDQADLALVLGDDELARGVVSIKALRGQTLPNEIAADQILQLINHDAALGAGSSRSTDVG